MAVWSLKKEQAAQVEVLPLVRMPLLRVCSCYPCGFRCISLVLWESGKPCEKEFNSGYFFLWRFFLRRFLRLCVAILWPFLFFPLGIVAEGYKG